jgi:hypothetical protein
VPSIRRFASLSALCVFGTACTPSGDLDAAARGSTGGSAGVGAAGGSSGGSSAAQSGSTSLGGNSLAAGGSGKGGTSNGGSAGQAGEQKAAGGQATGGAGSITGGASTGGSNEAGGGASGDATGGSGDASSGGNGASTGGNAGGSAGANGSLPDLPIDLVNPPVEGEVTFSAEAVWEIEGVNEPTFEIRTPTANYWLVKSLASLVSLTDRAPSGARQWLDFNSFRPLRGIPTFGSFGAAPKFSSQLDEDSRTRRHLRVTSETASGDWKLEWDFYSTHVTVTVRSAPAPYGFGYRGVPGGALDDADTLLSSDGSTRSALDSAVMDLSGTSEWVGLVDGGSSSALFLIQHWGDTLPDRYQVKDGDSALLLFGDAKLTQVPLRFSLGLIDSADAQQIRSRVDYVLGVVQ